MKSLTGKYVLHDRSGSYRTGKIIDATDDSVLVQFDMMTRTANDPSDVEFPMCLVSTEQFMREMDGDIPAWGIFESRDRLDAFIKWVNGGKPTNAVIRLVDRKPKKGK
jgi:hypothetical protein